MIILTEQDFLTTIRDLDTQLRRFAATSRALLDSRFTTRKEHAEIVRQLRSAIAESNRMLVAFGSYPERVPCGAAAPTAGIRTSIAEIEAMLAGIKSEGGAR